MAGLWSTGRGRVTFYVDDGQYPQSSISSNGDLPEANTIHDTRGELKRHINRNSRGIFFLPQRPYMVLGTLRQQLLYPMWAEDAVANSDSAKSTGMQLFFIF